MSLIQCARCLKHVSNADGEVHTCMPTPRWAALEAENAENWQKYVDANEALIDALAERDALRAALSDERLSKLIEDGKTAIDNAREAQEAGDERG